MARRSWRNFDYLLLGVLLALSAFGATMIYSATIDTLGIGDPLQRQIVFIVAGTFILLVTAAVNYQWLLILQHPIAFLTPLLMAFASVAAVLAWRAGQLLAQGIAPTAALLSRDLPAMAIGVGASMAVFVIDRSWIARLDMPLPRFLAVAGALGAAVLAALLVSRQDPARSRAMLPYLLAGALALAYLLDCLTLRLGDALRNPIYVVLLALLGLISVIGQVSGGSQRWLGAGTVQPSELAKILVVVVLAKFLADREDGLERFTTVLTSVGIVALPMALIYLQPDLGTALTLVAIWALMVWMAGIRFRHLLVFGGVGLVTLPVVWFGLEDYMRDRLTLFINPGSDPDSYYNVYQALVSIGSGGLTGKGLTQGTQSQLHFLRVRHTDFVFAVTAEELGFVGAAALLGLLFLLLWRILRVAGRSQDTFGRLVATGVAAIVLFQAVVNIGMNLGLMPVTGIPLPFVSYGGSSFLTLMVGLGLVESVAMRCKKLEFD